MFFSGTAEKPHGEHVKLHTEGNSTRTLELLLPAAPLHCATPPVFPQYPISGVSGIDLC